ncbi:MAG TPA: hypothetical protein VG937_15185 [Polyangiaceae bacterium]|nr:hypothetical protein [Polyangiaceae bacterium]
MTLRQKPPDLSDPADDPLLPFVVAAKSGDQGAERELLLRLTPMVLEVARGAYGPTDPDVTQLSLETLVATLKALPTFRGDESISEAVAQIALERAKATGRALHMPESAILAAARLRVQRGVRPGDGNRISSLVERALEDDAAVLVSHILVRTPKAGGLRAYTIAIVAGVMIVGILGWLWVKRGEPAQTPGGEPTQAP